MKVNYEGVTLPLLGMCQNTTLSDVEILCSLRAYSIWPNMQVGRNSHKALATIVLPHRYHEDTTTHWPVVIVFPGGGYKQLSAFNHGLEPACAFARAGFVSVICSYRTSEDQAPLQASVADGARCAQIIQFKSSSWRLGPCFLCGFSAGGHLAATLCYEQTWRDALWAARVCDEISRVKFQPTAIILVYAAMSETDCSKRFARLQLEQSLHFGNSQGNENWDFTLASRQVSPLLHVNSKWPPTLLVHCADDPVVPANESRAMTKKLNEIGCSSDLIMLSSSEIPFPHGFYIRPRHWLVPNMYDTYFKRIFCYLFYACFRIDLVLPRNLAPAIRRRFLAHLCNADASVHEWFNRCILFLKNEI